MTFGADWQANQMNESKRTSCVLRVGNVSRICNFFLDCHVLSQSVLYVRVLLFPGITTRPGKIIAFIFILNINLCNVSLFLNAACVCGLGRVYASCIFIKSKKSSQCCQILHVQIGEWSVQNEEHENENWQLKTEILK